jgi:hypothetical protein
MYRKWPRQVERASQPAFLKHGLGAGSPAVWGKFIQAESAKWQKVAKTAT